MKAGSKIMKYLHEIREKHYSQTRNKSAGLIEKEFKREVEDLIKKLGLNYKSSNKKIKKYLWDEKNFISERWRIEW